MATGRTVSKYLRVYVDEHGTFNDDFFSIGPLVNEFDAPMGAAFSDEIKNAKGGLGQGSISMGSLNGYLHTGASDLHENLGAGGVARIVSVLFGIRAVPAQGDPCFSAHMNQGAYNTQDISDGSILAVTMPLETVYAPAEMTTKALGYVLDPGALARTAVNASGGVDNAVESTAGGLAFLHLLVTDGTCTFSVQHSVDDADWSTFLTFAIAGDAVGSEIKATALPTTTVKRYTRWQLALGTATSVKFVMTLVRG